MKKYIAYCTKNNQWHYLKDITACCGEQATVLAARTAMKNLKLSSLEHAFDLVKVEKK